MDLHHRMAVLRTAAFAASPRARILGAGLRVARSLRVYEAREATAPTLPQRFPIFGGRGGCCPRNARSFRTARLATGCGHLSIRVSSEMLRLEPRAGVEPAFQSYQDCGLPLSDIGVVPARGVAPLFLPCHGSGLRLTYAGPLLFCALPVPRCPLPVDWSGSGDLHAAIPAPQAGGTLSSPEPGPVRLSSLLLFARCSLPVSVDWGDRPESHRLGSGSRPDGSTLCLRPPYWSARVVTLHGLPLIKRPVCF